MILLIAAIVAAGFFLRKKSYQYPYSWSQSSAEAMTFEKAAAFCDNLEEKGFSDWGLPELHEIRTLENFCIEEENPDFCAVTDSCEWDSCEHELCGKCIKYDKTVETGTFWTKTPFHGGKVFVFTISTEETEENQAAKSEKHFVKCVRSL